MAKKKQRRKASPASKAGGTTAPRATEATPPARGRARAAAFGAMAVMVVAIGVWWSLDRTPPPPPPPTLDLEGLDPRMAERVRAALRAATEEPSAASYGRLGLTYHAHRYVALAQESYRIASELDPEVADWHYYLGLLAAERGETTQALRELDAARAAGHDSPALHERLGHAHLAAQDLEAAGAAFERLAERPGSRARGLLGQARVALRRQQTPAALDLLRESVELDPDDRAATYLLATTLSREGLRGEAAPLLARLPRLEEQRPSDPLVDRIYDYRADLESVLQRGSALLEQGNVAAAEAEYRSILALDQDHVDALFNLGLLLGRTERFEEAEGTLRRAVRLAPARTDARLMLAMSMASQGRIDDARAALEELLEIDPGNERALQLLASQPDP